MPLAKTSTVPIFLSVFLGFPFFELVSLTGLGSSAPEAALTGMVVAVVISLLLVLPLTRRPPRSPGDPFCHFECPVLTMGLRVGMILAIGVALRAVFLFWRMAVSQWIEVRPSHVILEPLLSVASGATVTLAITGAFVAWALWRGLGNLVRLRATTQILSGVAVMILFFALLSYQRALSSMWTGFGGWNVWDLRQSSILWLYACAAALASPALVGTTLRQRVLDGCGIAAAFALAGLTSWAPVAALRMRGGNLTGSPPDVFIVIGWTGRGALGGEYSGSALLILLASMGTLMAFAFVLTRAWPFRWPRVVASVVMVAAWLSWPAVDLMQIGRFLHGFGLTLSVLAGVAVARSFAAASAILERIATAAGFAFAVLAWQSSERGRSIICRFSSARC